MGHRFLFQWFHSWHCRSLACETLNFRFIDHNSPDWPAISSHTQLLSLEFLWVNTFGRALVSRLHCAPPPHVCWNPNPSTSECGGIWREGLQGGDWGALRQWRWEPMSWQEEEAACAETPGLRAHRHGGKRQQEAGIHKWRRGLGGIPTCPHLHLGCPASRTGENTFLGLRCPAWYLAGLACL